MMTRFHPMSAFVTLTTAAAIGALVLVTRSGVTPQLHQLPILVGFGGLAVLAELYATRIPAFRMELSSSVAIYLATLFILGQPLAMVTVLISSAVSESVLRWRLRGRGWRGFAVPAAFNISQLLLSLGAAGGILAMAGRGTIGLSTATEFAWAVGAFAAYVLVNHSLVTGAVAISSHQRFFPSLWRGIAQFGVQYMVLCTAALLITVLHGLSVWHVWLALIPLTLVHVSFRGWVRLQTEARRTFERISKLLDARDHATAVHSDEVAELAVRLGTELGLTPKQIERLDIASRVHDIGKMAIPDAILLKPGPLTDAEWEQMKTHPGISAELIEGLEIYAPVANAVRHEHERWDGSGYPDGLRGEQIPLLARVIAVADTYCALTSDRPYRPAFPSAKAEALLAEMRGRELDPKMVDALLGLLCTQSRRAEPVAMAKHTVAE
jgi:HD-GYP domain-containing protein (c-di-GMP phosphodiesterase class II)